MGSRRDVLSSGSYIIISTLAPSYW